RRIDERAARLRPRRGGEMRRLDMVGPEDMQHRLASGEQVVGDDAAVAAPPHRLGAHHRARRGVAEFAQMREPALKVGAERVVGVMMEARMLPEAVDLVGDAVLTATAATEGGYVLIADPVALERGRQR